VNARSAAAERPATIPDVARRAGVSHETLSRVINRSPKVAETTRERVLWAIRELGYDDLPVADYVEPALTTVH
jgi:DNA-binding LacI/PurR family transcriptional regulator